MKKISVLLAMAFFCFVGTAVSADFEKELAKAFINIPPDASNASMGNTWVATPLFGSNSAAVTAMGTYEYGGVSLNYGVIDFKKGPDVQFYSPAVAVKLPIGILQFSYAAGDSGRKTFREEFSEEGGFSDDIEFDSIKQVDLQYGFKAAEKIFFEDDKFYVGLGYNHGKSRIRFGSAVGTPATSFTASLDSESRSHTWSTGVVYQPNPLVSVGGFYAHSWDKTEDSLDFEGFVEEGTTRSQSNQYRFGVGIQATPSTFIAADFQHLDLPSGNSDQLFAGIEQGIYKDFLYAYGGWAGDGPTAGVGMYFPMGGANVAYMHDTNDGLNETLGKTRIVMISAYVNF